MSTPVLKEERYVDDQYSCIIIDDTTCQSSFCVKLAFSVPARCRLFPTVLVLSTPAPCKVWLCASPASRISQRRPLCVAMPILWEPQYVERSTLLLHTLLHTPSVDPSTRYIIIIMMLALGMRVAVHLVLFSENDIGKI